MASQPGLVTLPGTWTGAQYTSRAHSPSLFPPPRLFADYPSYLSFPGGSVRFARVFNALLIHVPVVVLAR